MDWVKKNGECGGLEVFAQFRYDVDAGCGYWVVDAGLDLAKEFLYFLRSRGISLLSEK